MKEKVIQKYILEIFKIGFVETQGYMLSAALILMGWYGICRSHAIRAPWDSARRTHWTV